MGKPPRDTSELIERIAPFDYWAVCPRGHITCPGTQRPSRCIRNWDDHGTGVDAHVGVYRECLLPTIWVRDVPALVSALLIGLGAQDADIVRDMLEALGVFK